MHHYSGALSSHDGWQMLNLDGVEIEARVFCEKNYYGKSCENYCIPNYSDHSGHYKCNAKTGEKVCHDGWKTTMNAIKCTTRKLSTEVFNFVNFVFYPNFWRPYELELFIRPIVPRNKILFQKKIFLFFENCQNEWIMTFWYWSASEDKMV